MTKTPWAPVEAKFLGQRGDMLATVARSAVG
jgi:hypothetical protein